MRWNDLSERDATNEPIAIALYRRIEDAFVQSGNEIALARRPSTNPRLEDTITRTRPTMR